MPMLVIRKGILRSSTYLANMVNWLFATVWPARAVSFSDPLCALIIFPDLT
jgi:hypothetical protein